MPIQSVGILGNIVVFISGPFASVAHVVEVVVRSIVEVLLSQSMKDMTNVRETVRQRHSS